METFVCLVNFIKCGEDNTRKIIFNFHHSSNDILMNSNSRQAALLYKGKERLGRKPFEFYGRKTEKPRETDF